MSGRALRRRAFGAVLAVAGPACALFGCNEVEAFETGPGEVYHGEVIGSDSGSVDGGGSFIRSGFAPGTQMELTFDPSLASRPVRAADRPKAVGTIETYRCPETTPRCAREQRMPGQFADAALERIRNLSHDPLSQYDFPGGGRLRNYILGTQTSGQAGGESGRDAMVFVSLMENGEIEVRVVALGGRGEDADSEEPLFGVFVLERHKR